MSRPRPETLTHYRTCHLCETMCGIAVEYRGDEIISIRGDKDHVLSKGNICPKSAGLQVWTTRTTHFGVCETSLSL